VKIRAIARNTLLGLLQDKIIILFLAIFVCVLLLMVTPLIGLKAMAKANVAQGEGMVLGFVGIIMSLVSGFGSLLAAWAAGNAVASEIRSGTILAVMARPVRRWEFLVGKFIGVQLLLVIYVMATFGFSYLLAWIGGQRIHSAPWVLIVYPLVRYAIYSAIAFLLVTMMHPVAAFGCVLLISVLAEIAGPGRSFLPGWLRAGIYYVLPSTSLLSESRFLTITQAALKPVPWRDHAITLAYGLDYALVFFLLAVWSFRFRNLSRD
jgi:ABC-type transport system involved in multi-copper enzyme maturation permease subunit